MTPRMFENILALCNECILISSAAFTSDGYGRWILRSSLSVNMTSIRQCRMTDLLKMSLCNLDPLTENYDTHFYIEYMARWPSLFTVAENRNGDIIGYSETSRM